MDNEILNLLIPGALIFKIPIFLVVLSVFTLSPFIGLLTYLSCITLNPQTFSLTLVNIHFTRIAAILLIILSFLKLSNKDFMKAFKVHQSKLLLALLLIVLASSLAGWWVKVLEVFEQMAKNVILYFLVVMTINTKKRLRRTLWVWLIFLGILAANTVYAFHLYGPEIAERVRLGGYDSSYFGGAGDFALIMNVAFALAFFLFMGERNIFLKLASLSLAVLFIIAMVSTYARGGGIIAFFGILAFMVFLGMRSKVNLQKAFCIVLPVIFLMGVFAYSPSNFIERIETIKDFRAGTGGARIEYWKIGVAMFYYNPILGVGAGHYPLEYHNYGGWEAQARVPHNMFIEAASELGIGGITCLFLLLFFSYRQASSSTRLMESRRKTRDILYYISQGLTCALAGYCLGGMFQSVFKYPFLYFLIGLIVAAGNITLHEVRAE